MLPLRRLEASCVTCSSMVLPESPKNGFASLELFRSSLLQILRQLESQSAINYSSRRGIVSCRQGTWIEGGSQHDQIRRDCKYQSETAYEFTSRQPIRDLNAFGSSDTLCRYQIRMQTRGRTPRASVLPHPKSCSGSQSNP